LPLGGYGIWGVWVFLLSFSLTSFKGMAVIGKRRNIVYGMEELAMIYIIISISLNRVLEYLL
jgi:hypothetical protein